MISKEVEKTLGAALTQARQRRHEYLCVEHLLYAMLDDPHGRDILLQCGGSIERMRRSLEDFFDKEIEKAPAGAEPAIQQTVGFERVMENAILHVRHSGKREVDNGDILAAIFEEKNSHAAYFLSQEGITRLGVLNYISHGIPATRYGAPDEDEEDDAAEKDGPQVARNPLDTYTVNLSRRAAEGKIDPLIGRELEIQRTIRILSRRRKNNPIYVGEPGVGKTALAEGLALKIFQGLVPAPMKDTEILMLDLAALLAGTKFRGDFEARLKSVINELVRRKRVVLFIDEIHTVVGAGSTVDSAMDASTILKPVLASGELRCIGSTTFEEYRNHFEKDRALSRRFQKVEVAEPTVEETVRILRGLKSRYEEHHGIRYTDAALRTAADMSARYINDRFLPDKAIDVIDEAGASARLATGAKKTVRPIDVEKIIAEIARIPERRVSSNDKERLATLEQELRSVVFGQDDAIHSIVTAIKRSRAGLGRTEKPIGSFLFTGPTGVGKTEVARQLALVLGVYFTRYDMSEYMEKHTVSRLIGAPPGYVGFDQGGLLTDDIRRHPYAVLLLDEIEKAHMDLFSILLQVMDHATLTDNTGKKADFRNVILIMTSNAGARELATNAIGFRSELEDKSGKGVRAIEKMFSPEFRNRLDSVIAFKTLPIEVIERVVDKFMREIQVQLARSNVRITLTEAARHWLAVNGFDHNFGARPLGRLIETEIITQLSDEILFGRLEKGGGVVVDEKDGKLGFTFDGATQADTVTT